MTQIVVLPDADAVAGHVAASIAGWLKEGLATRERVHLALGGGRTPAAVHVRLAAMLRDWSGVELWLGDERIADSRRPGERVERNIDLVGATLIDALGSHIGAVHAVPEMSADEAAAAYTCEMAARLPDGQLDVAYLGLGEDGHTASLFPNASQLQISAPGCVAVRCAPKPPPHRVTMTLATLRGARHVIIAATGFEKADAVSRTVGLPNRAVPASLLGAALTELVVDEAAASRLSLR